MVRSSCKLAVNCLAFLRLSHAEDYTPTVDFKLARVSVGQRLGVGSYGEVFTGLLDGERDVVLKRPRGSGIISRRFFRAEVHACRRLRRCRGVAPFLGVAGADAYLVWEDIGLTTLEDVLKCRRPGPAAQEGLTEALQLPDSVSAAVAVKTLAKRLIAACAAVHAASFVHRDVKPANCLLAADGGVRLIDLGAAADMGTRLFFDPDEAVFDPLWGPPEQFLDVSAQPPVGIAAAGGLGLRLAGLFARARGGAPAEAFDSFSAGLVILTVAVPALGVGPSDRLRKLKAMLEADAAGGDAAVRWRATLPDNMQRDFGILDAEDEAGWDLVRKLCAPEPQDRLLCDAALAHRFLKGV